MIQGFRIQEVPRALGVVLGAIAHTVVVHIVLTGGYLPGVRGRILEIASDIGLDLCFISLDLRHG